MNIEIFQADQKTIDAVVRRLTIIGEAASRLPEEVCFLAPHIPWADMRAMRNFVVHEYFGISNRILWDTVQHNLPQVVEPLRRLLENSEKSG
jgi:uncharacterized protein with HEPN domain